MEASDWPLGVEGHLPGRGGGPTALSPLYQDATQNFRLNPILRRFLHLQDFSPAPILALHLLAFALLPA
jgi:hypothetical protein